MANTIEASGTQTAVINTEHSLHTDSDAKTFVLLVDLNNLVAGEFVELRVKAMVLSGGTRRLMYYGCFTFQDEKIVASIPIPAPGHTDGVEFSLKQVTGVGRAFPWSVVSLG